MRVVGRYALYAEIAAGGMATVHFGRLLGPVGFSRTVAIKRLHPQFAKDPEFVSMFLDEARLAARIRHPNVVPTLDVVATHGELFLVMEYIQGESLSRLLRAMRDKKERIPPRIVTTVMSGALHGLHAAHEARDERGEPLGIVHRDISPQNVLVGTDGVARVLDFGVAKAAGRIQTTREGQLKGKLAYMAPEQLQGHVTRQSDIYAAAIVLWEALTGQRLFGGDNEAAVLGKVLNGTVDPPSRHYGTRGEIDDGLRQLDAVVLRGLDRDPARRYGTAREMAIAVERCVGVASPSEVGDWVETAARDVLSRRAEKVAEIESTSSSLHAPSSPDSGSQLAPPNSGSALQAAIAASIGSDPSGRFSIPSAPSSRPSGASSSGRFDASKSQLSSISLSKPRVDSMAVPARNRMAVLAGLAGVVVAVLLVATTVLVMKLQERNAARAAAAIAPPARDADAGLTQPLAVAPATSSAPPLVTAAATVTTTAADARADAGTASVSEKPVVRKPATHAATRTVRAPTGCDPPWTVDEAGRKHYKMQCL